jgi:hypothetical protein
MGGQEEATAIPSGKPLAGGMIFPVNISGFYELHGPNVHGIDLSKAAQRKTSDASDIAPP